MYTLHYAPGTASFAVHWMLLELGVDHTLERVDLGARAHKHPAYLALNPNGLVPTLIVDGAPVYECAAILTLLAERHPDAGLAPPLASPARGAYHQWLFHLSNTLQPQYRAWFFPKEPAGEGQEEAVKRGAQSRIEAAWDRIDAQLAAGGPYLTGADLTAADFLATMLMRWSRNMPRPATGWPAIADYVTRMKARPAFKTLYAREGLTEWA